MPEKYDSAFVADGRSVTTLKGIAHAGAKIKWSDLDGKTEQTKKALFTKLLKDGFLEPGKSQADKFREDLAGQMGFGDEPPEGKPPGDESPEGKPPKGKPPEGKPPGDEAPKKKKIRG